MKEKVFKVEIINVSVRKVFSDPQNKGKYNGMKLVMVFDKPVLDLTTEQSESLETKYIFVERKRVECYFPTFLEPLTSMFNVAQAATFERIIAKLEANTRVAGLKGLDNPDVILDIMDEKQLSWRIAAWQMLLRSLLNKAMVELHAKPIKVGDKLEDGTTAEKNRVEYEVKDLKIEDLSTKLYLPLVVDELIDKGIDDVRAKFGLTTDK